MTDLLAWRAALLNSALPSSVKLVGLVLHAFADADGSACLTTGSIAAAASLGDRSVQGAVTALVEAGYLHGARC